MSRSASRFALFCALVGLGASVSAAYVHYRLLYDPRYLSFCDVNATISCTQVYLSRFSTVRGIPVAIFGALWFVAAALLSAGAMTARQSVRDSMPGYLFVALDARALGRPVPGLCVLRADQGRVPAVSDHVCRRDRTLPRFRSGHVLSHENLASPRRERLARVCRQSARHRGRGGVLRRRRHDARVLSARGAVDDGLGRDRRGGGAAADAGPALGVRALFRRAAARAARSCRPTAPRCSSSSSTTISARRAGSRT